MISYGDNLIIAYLIKSIIEMLTWGALKEIYNIPKYVKILIFIVSQSSCNFFVFLMSALYFFHLCLSSLIINSCLQEILRYLSRNRIEDLHLHMITTH